MWPDSTETDLSCSRTFDVEQLLNDPAHNTILLTVAKRNGNTINVSLTKAMIQIDENTITSFILEGEQKIGYIYLPGFYTDYTHTYPLGCANDVAREIVKLKKENISGLILDLRNNGGGAIYEALGLFGIFVNEGPFAISYHKGDKPRLLKDMNRGTIFNGPLALMVNGESASASEMLAASLQDYNRAIIVGEKTFGKSTGQIILPLDSSINSTNANLYKNESELGFIKVTTGKYYRINGQTAQLKGVIPDIELPEIHTATSEREADYLHALSSDSVNKKVYFTPLPKLPITELNKKSHTRTGQQPNFTQIIALNDSLKKQQTTEEILFLTPENVQQFILKNETESESFAKTMEKTTTTYKVNNNQFNQPLIALDSIRNTLNQQLLESIGKDIYIEETYNILTDIIDIKQ